MLARALLMADLLLHTAAAEAAQHTLVHYGNAHGTAHDDDESKRKRRLQRQQYPLNVMVDFTKLRANALRRYMAFHGIQEIPGSSREQLAVVVARHFNEQCKLTDEETSIASFLTYIKGSRTVANDRDNHTTHGKTAVDHGDHDKEGVALVNGGDHDADPSSTATSASDAGGDQVDDQDDDDDDDDDDGDGGAQDKRRRSSSLTHHSRTSTAAASSRASHSKKKKKRKTRLYCVCQGASFGNMIACDNKKCIDRSNWFHMVCVDLDPTQDPPETWYCPSCVEHDAADVPENQYRKPVASVTYSDMISHALTALPARKGTFKEICDFVEKQYESQLNWKLESDQRKSPVWKSSVRKILFSNMRFRKHPEDKGLFCLAA